MASMMIIGLMLCIGAVLSQDVAPQEATGLVYERPLPWIPARRCTAVTGGYYWLPVAAPTPAPANTLYWNCQVRKPRYTRCTGGCSSGESYVPGFPGSFREHCYCCKSVFWQLVLPKPRCLVIRIANGQVTFSYQYVTDSATSQANRYAQIGRCSCQNCNGRRTAEDDEVEEETSAVDKIASAQETPEVEIEGKPPTVEEVNLALASLGQIEYLIEVDNNGNIIREAPEEPVIPPREIPEVPRREPPSRFSRRN